MVHPIMKITAVSSVGNGNCRLHGENVGPYPKHHFTWLYPDVRSKDWALQISFAGPDENVAGVWRSRENSDTFSLEYVQEGSFSFRQNDLDYLCQKGDLFIIHMGASMHMRCQSDYAVKHTIAMVGNILPQLVSSLGLASVDVMPQIASPQVDKLFGDAFALVENKPKNHLQEASVLAYRLLLALSQHGQRRRLPEQLRGILQYLETHYAADLTVDRLSQHFNISKATLFRLFRKHLHNSPIEQLISVRMQRAKILLLERQYSIKDIAHLVGYHNPSFFTAEFKRINGQTPSAYRQQNMNY
jgi:AraC-like DNA-binding protein